MERWQRHAGPLGLRRPGTYTDTGINTQIYTVTQTRRERQTPTCRVASASCLSHNKAKTSHPHEPE